MRGMAAIVETKTLDDGRVVNVYASGVALDASTGKIVKPYPGGVMSPELSQQLHSRKREAKRAAVIRAANRVAAEGGQYDGADMDFVEALTDAQMQRALDVDSKAGTDAAEWVMMHAGMSERIRDDTPAQVASDLADDIVARIADLLARDVVDGTVIRSEDDGK